MKPFEDLTNEERVRFSRHLILPEIGESGQRRLRQSSVLVVGAGGLGCSALLGIAGAGVGTIGIADFDSVSLSNLQRQVLYTTSDVGAPKVSAAIARLRERYPHCGYKPCETKISNLNALEIISGFDVIIDCTDDFATRYVINDACVLLGKPLVYGALSKFSGQVSVFNYPVDGDLSSSTYRCLFPKPPVNDSVKDCVSEGVFCPLPQMIGLLQSTQALKMLLGMEGVLSNRVMIADLLSMKFTELFVERNESVWGDSPRSPKEFMTYDYSWFCRTQKSAAEITPALLAEWITIDPGLPVFDVREEWEEPAPIGLQVTRIPLERIRELTVSGKSVVVCQLGNRSQMAVNILNNNKIPPVCFSLKGGIAAWNTFITQKEHERA